MLTTTDTGDAPSQSAVAGNLAVGPGFRAGRVIGLFLLILALLDELYQAEHRLLDGQIIDVPFTRLVAIAAEGLGNRVLPFEVERRGDRCGGIVSEAHPAFRWVPAFVLASALVAFVASLHRACPRQVHP